MGLLSVFFLTLAVASILGNSPDGSDTAKTLSPGLQADVSAANQAIANLPVIFIENKGQTDEKVAYSAKTKSGTLFIGKDGTMTYNFSLADNKSIAYREKFAGSQTTTPIGQSPAVTKYSYYQGSDSNNWQTGVTGFNSVSLPQAFDNIDVQLKGKNGNVEKIFIVHPAGDPSDIKMSFEGIKGLSVADAGSLSIQTAGGEFTMSKPVAHQMIDGAKKEVQIAYNLLGKTGYGFTVGSYDKNYDLIIDPILASTVLGGSGEDHGQSVVIVGGSVYVAGKTSSTDFPATVGAVQGTLVGAREVFISKFSSDLTTLEASGNIYKGTPSNDANINMASDGASIYIVGSTSGGLPTTAGVIKTSVSSTDGFISKLSLDLGTLQASTYFGGSYIDGIDGIVLDGGSIYISGFQWSSNFPTTAGAYDTIYDGQGAFVSKLSTDLTTIQASTFIGTSKDLTIGNGLTAYNNEIILYGRSTSTADTIPIVGSPYQSTKNGSAHLFVSKLSSDLSTLLASTYIGGSSSGEYAETVAHDSNGNIFINGITNSSDYPTTPGAYDTYSGSDYKGFISKLSNDLSTLSASTYFGSGASVEWDIKFDLKIDTDNVVYVTGHNESSGFNPSPNALSSCEITRYFIGKLSNDLSTLIKRTSTSGWDGAGIAYYATAESLAFSGNNIYIAGTAPSEQIQLWGTYGSSGYDTTRNGNKDAYVSEVTNDLTASSHLAPTDIQAEASIYRAGILLTWDEPADAAGLQGIGSGIPYYIRYGINGECDPLTSPYTNCSTAVTGNSATSYDLTGLQYDTQYIIAIYSYNNLDCNYSLPSDTVIITTTTDADDDNVANALDNCPAEANSGQENADMEMTNLSNNPYFDAYPVSSPDGTKIAFMSSRDGNNEIYIMDADGTDQTKLTDNTAEDTNPIFSPDGTKIVFTSYRDDNYEIYIMNVDGSSQVNLSNNLGGDYHPIFSPDGTKITFYSDRDGNNEIYIMDADGTDQTRLTNNAIEDYVTSFSPDGTKIAFNSYNSGWEIYIMDADGTDQTRLTNNAAEDWNPIFSSTDNNKIAFNSFSDGFWKIYTVDASGGNLTMLNDYASDFPIAFSPDGTKIAFSSIMSGDYRLYTMDATDGSNVTRVTNNTGMTSSFSPDGSKIIYADGWQIFTANSDPDAVGDACDCKTDTFCTAQAYCAGESTPDYDCTIHVSDAVTDLAGLPNGSGTVDLSWTAPYDYGNPISDYLVEYNDGSGWASFSDGVSVLTAASVTGLTNFQEYSFRVRAVNVNGNSDYSNIAQATPILDTDSDGIGDNIDNCPLAPNAGQENSDRLANLTNNALGNTGPMYSPISNNKIVFTSSMDGNNEIYTMDADGSNVVRLTDNASYDFNPVFSPNATKIAFNSDGDNYNDIFIMDADGTNQVNLTDDPSFNSKPVFSPDGTKITFYTDRDGDNEIYTMDSSDGGNLTKLTDNDANDAEPVFSPDGTKIVFWSNRDPWSDIYIMDADGQNQINLTNSLGDNYSPSFSPDGTKIVFMSDREGIWEVYTMDVDGTDQTRLTDNLSEESLPIFSPDGTKIAFISYANWTYNLYVMDTDGQNQINMNSNGLYLYYDSYPSFSPDSTKMVLYGGDYDIYSATLPPENIGNACDCQTDNLCTARLYCIAESTPDADCPLDTDGDGITDDIDNCLLVSNPLQENTDGPTPTNLTNNPVYDDYPIMSPDDTKIAFTSDRSGTYQIYTMNSDGTGSPTNLTNDSDWNSHPIFSPDGTKIAYTAYLVDGSQQEAFVMDADGSNKINLSNNSGEEFNPIFSPDGTKIAFTSLGDGIDLVNPNGTGLTRLTYHTSAVDSPVFSPDGSKVAFHATQDGNDEIYIINTNGTGELNLSNSSGSSEQYPVFSPDGTKIAFVSDRDGNPEIYIMDADDGGNQVNLTNNAGEDRNPIFSPDGTKIAFNSYRNGQDDIYIMNVDGSIQIKVTNTSSSEYYLNFSSDGTKLIFSAGETGDYEIYAISSNPDTIGNACDCGTDLLCTAETYCTNQSTPDADCGGAISCEYTAISGGGNTSLAIKNDGTVWSWGNNQYGQLGYATPDADGIPQQVPDISGFTNVLANHHYSLGLKDNNTVWTWGRFYYGGSDGDYNENTTPTQVSELTNVTAITSDPFHALALDGDGNVWAWGYNEFGQLGNESNTNRTSPVQVSNLTGVTAVASGYYHSLALDGDGNVWAWGRNAWGNLGNGTYNNSNVPVQVSGLTDVIAIAGGYMHSLALKDDGTVWAWGANVSGLLGDGTTTWSNVPVQVTQSTGLTNVSAIASGDSFSIALKSDGTVWVWGNNYAGQLGNGSTDPESIVPVQVSNLTNIIAISAGQDHALALKNDGTAWSWGYNSLGQLGDGTIQDSNVPIQIFAPGCELPPTDTAPDAPVLTSATPGNTSTALVWTAPNDGGSPITGYRIQYGDVGGDCSASDVVTYESINCSSMTLLDPATSETIFMLTNGTTYRFAVFAINAIGAGPASNVLTSTPDTDSDSDGILNGLDNCPTVANPGQENTDAQTTTNLTNDSGGDDDFAFSPDGTRIAFDSDRDGNGEIYIMDADGTDTSRLTNDPGEDYYPLFSPDGTKIAFTSYRDGNPEIYIMDADGTDTSRLTNDPNEDFSPVFSPNGTKIAFASNRDGNNEIYTMDASDGGNLTNLTNDSNYDGYPVFSPDGTKIAFQSDRDGNQDIYIMNADGSNQTNLTNASDYDGLPAFSPDGTKIVFTSYRDGNGEIYIMDASDGGNLINLSNDSNYDGDPVFSPNGTKIAFVSDRGGTNEIYIMDASDGGNLINLSNDSGEDYNTAFSPDGTKIAFVSDRDGNSEIYTVNTNSDTIGNACDCGTDLLCTAETYCTNQSTPDADCGGGTGPTGGGTLTTSTNVPNEIPGFDVAPSDNGSDGTSPTDVGSNVTFTATATDVNLDDYYLAVCKTGAISPNSGSAPTCTDDAWGVSGATASGTEATVTRTAQSGDAESDDWYAFVCDGNGSGLCSSAGQGSGSNGSPFKVNHAGTYGTVTVTDTSDGTIAPGDTLKFKLPNTQIDDTDSDTAQDTLTMHVCTADTASYNYNTNTCTGGTSICDSSAVDPTSADASCTGGTNLVSVPTAHGTYHFKVYVEDQHDFPATGTADQTYAVIDVDPVLGAWTTGDNIDGTIPAGGSDQMEFSVIVSDDNGDNDVTNVEGRFFDKTAVANTCTASEKNCYIQPSCALSGQSSAGSGKTAMGTDKDLTASCAVTVWFNADASTNWEFHVNPTDSTVVKTNLSDTDVNKTVAPLSAIGVEEATIGYGTVALGGDSAPKVTTMQNQGNQVLDVLLSGSDMTSGGNSISRSQQKWFHADTDFDWSTGGGYGLMSPATAGGNDAQGCLNRDMAVRAVHGTGTEDEAIGWKIRIPASQQSGSYTGTNTFATASSSSCTGTLY